MKKRIVAVVLCLAIVLCLCPRLTLQANAYGQYTGNRDWKWPVPGWSRISSCFLNMGYSEHAKQGGHYALDIPASEGTPVYASYPGHVLYTDWSDSLGWCVYILHNYLGTSFVSRYGHMSSLNISGNPDVTKSTVIGYVGSTGWSTGNHLDFTIYHGDNCNMTSWGSKAETVVDPFLDQFLEMPDGFGVTSDGAYCCYEYANKAKELYSHPAGEPRMWFENSNMTSNILLGQNFSFNCTICSNNGVKWYALVIYDSNNNAVQIEGEDVWKVASTNSYPVTNAAQRLNFAGLSEGSYKLSVQCMDNDDNYYTIYDKSFTVSKPTMWFEGSNMTDSILLGHDYSFQCTVCSNNGVKWYALVIYDSDNQAVQIEGEDVWKVASTNSYPVTNAAQRLNFAALSEGTYLLSVQCMDNDDNYFTIYDKSFTVTSPQMWCEDVNMLDEIAVGKPFSLSGTVLGNNYVKWYALVIYDSNNQAIQIKGEDVWKVASTKSYSIANAAAQLDFAALPIGSYRLSIQSMDNDDNYYSAYEKTFKVTNPRMWCEEVNMPDEITLGENFTLRGNICGNNYVKWYAIVIYDKNNVDIQNKGEAVWKVAHPYSYPINNVADQLDFSILPAGNYRLSIQSMDDDDNYFGAYEKSFTVRCSQHDYSTSVVAPTCTDQGYTVYTCSICSDTYVSDYVPATGHNYEDVVVPATCTEQGFTTHTCSVCGDSYIDSNVDALGHDFVYSVTKEPTTTITGTLTGACSRCDSTTAITLPKLNATDYTYSVVTPASCTATGTGRYTWKTTTYGTFSFDVTIAKTNHSYVDTVTPPTCTEQGYTTHSCSVCGDSYVDSYVDALGHNFGEWTQTVPPTCTTKGSESRTCSRCSTTEVREVNALEHDLIHHAAQAPTCTAIGWDAYNTCSRCDYTTYVEKAALGHNYQATVTAPTCTEKGYTTHTCSRCGDSYVDSYIEASGHKPGTAIEENRVNPTCTNNGGFDTVTFCSACGIELSRVHTDLAALGHLWDDGVINPVPNCTMDGVKTFTCQRCGEIKTEAIAATGHTQGEAVKENEVAATCTTVGGYDMVIRCTVCDAILYTEHFEVAALGHDYQAVVTEPTCTEGGYTTYTCSRCGDSYVADETEPTGHTPAEPVKENETASTCTEAGGYDMVVYCSVCNADISREHTEIQATGHDWNAPTYVWVDDCSEITATRICKNDASHIETEKGVITSEVTLEATYDVEGEITYTATFTNPAFATQTKKVATPKLEKPDDGLPCDGGESCPGNRFTDMPPKGNWAHDPIDWAIVTGVTSGTSETTFSPNAGCTRAQVVTFLWRAAGSPEPTSTSNPFTDVTGGYYYKAVLWAVEKNITSGTSATTFSPNATCTRAQIVTFLWRFEGEPASTTTTNPFTDVKPGAYYEKAVLWAAETGVTAGTSATTFSPNATCTRAQIVTFLYRDIV